MRHSCLYSYYLRSNMNSLLDFRGDVSSDPQSRLRQSPFLKAVREEKGVMCSIAGVLMSCEPSAS